MSEMPRLTLRIALDILERMEQGGRWEFIGPTRYGGIKGVRIFLERRMPEMLDALVCLDSQPHPQGLCITIYQTVETWWGMEEVKHNEGLIWIPAREAVSRDAS